MLLPVALGGVAGPVLSGRERSNCLFQWHWPPGVISQSPPEMEHRGSNLGTRHGALGIEQFAKGFVGKWS